MRSSFARCRPPSMPSACCSESEGNPFFAMEMARALETARHRSRNAGAAHRRSLQSTRGADRGAARLDRGARPKARSNLVGQVSPLLSTDLLTGIEELERRGIFAKLSFGRRSRVVRLRARPHSSGRVPQDVGAATTLASPRGIARALSGSPTRPVTSLPTCPSRRARRRRRALRARLHHRRRALHSHVRQRRSATLANRGRQRLDHLDPDRPDSSAHRPASGSASRNQAPGVLAHESSKSELSRERSSRRNRRGSPQR